MLNNDEAKENAILKNRSFKGSHADPAGANVSDFSPIGEGAQTEKQNTTPVGLSGAAKGIAYILYERLGSVPTPEIFHLIRTLQENDKPRLARLGLRFGVETVYMPELLKPAQIELRSLLPSPMTNFMTAPPAWTSGD